MTAKEAATGTKPPAMRARRSRIGRTDESTGTRALPQETPVAFTYGRQTHAVMLATPADLEDFAVGFSFTERLADAPAEIEELEIVDLPSGVELRMSLTGERADLAEARRRRMAGPAGCGLCGIESLAAATAPPPPVRAELQVETAEIFRALAALREHQPLNDETRGVHAAGFWSPSAHRFLAVREDVGRHNALDKLIGALLRADIAPGDGFIVLTSRVSIELVQKTAKIGCPVLVAISVPTALALETAEAANITLAAIARDDGFEVFTHARRIRTAAHVA
ncbi:MAG: formate dehydrogenase accessory sulfurtransferase FdhD [Rhizomicrobium sp.]